MMNLLLSTAIGIARKFSYETGIGIGLYMTHVKGQKHEVALALPFIIIYYQID